MTEDGRIKKLYPKQWLEIVSLAGSGMRVAAIAEKYDVTPNAIYAGLKKRGVDLTAVAAKATREENDRAREETLKKIKETKDTDYTATVFFQNRMVKVVNDCLKNGHSLASVQDDVKTLKIALDGFANGTRNKWHILGLDKLNENADAILPELPIRDMTTEEFQALRRRQEQEDGGMQFDDDGNPIIEDAIEDEEDDRLSEGDEDDEAAVAAELDA